MVQCLPKKWRLTTVVEAIGDHEPRHFSSLNWRDRKMLFDKQDLSNNHKGWLAAMVLNQRACLDEAELKGM